MRQIEGRNPIIEALNANLKIEKIIIQEGLKGGPITEIQNLARSKKVTVVRESKNAIDNIADSSTHQGVIAIAEDYRYVDLDEILEYAKSKGEKPLVVLLDEIQDPYNLGSIIRTANAAGVHGIVIPKHRATEVTSVVSKSSAGAVEFTKVAQVTNLVRAIEDLQKAGLWFVGADVEGDQVIYQADLKGPLGIVIGSEGSGLRRLVRERCDYLVKIPMFGQINSLNASVAAGVMIYEIVRQRNFSK